MHTDDFNALASSWINGRPQAFQGDRIVSVNPATAEVAGAYTDSGPDGVNDAVQSARAAFKGDWGRLNGAGRGERLTAWAKAIEDESEQLAWLETMEVGRPITDARAVIAQVGKLPLFYRNMIGRLEARAEGVRRPRGVIGAITPWNFPTGNVLLRVAPILAAGNTVVLKPSELCPRSAVLLARLASTAGLPPGAFNVVVGSGRSTGDALVAHPDVSMITFTGSSATGQDVVRRSAEGQLKPVMLECGGKSPQLILPDMIDDPAIWSHVFTAAFWNTGQWCMANSRLLVPAGRVDVAVQGLVEAASQWRVGEPGDPETSLGPLASRNQFERVRAYRDQAKRAAEVIALPCPKGNVAADGYYVTPELVIRPPQDCAVVQEEVFGPLLTVQEYGGVEEAVTLANGTCYGLGATVWTKDPAIAEHVAASLEVGVVSVIRTTASAGGLDLSGSFEPRRQSGFGVDGGFAGLAGYTAVQALSITG